MEGQKREGAFNVAVIFIIAVLMAALFPRLARAKRGSDDHRQTFYAVESRFHGIIQARPQSLHGKWVIGGRSYTTTGKTKFNQDEGPLLVGTCAKVRIRNWHFREIESKPMSKCR